MRKTFGSAFALIMVALFTVAPTSPATAYPGGIHLHIAGKVGQKAVGSTIIFGTEGLTEAPQTFGPTACLWWTKAVPDGELDQCPVVGSTRNVVGIQIPVSGNYANQIPLPDLPAGKYEMWFVAFPSGSDQGLEFPLVLGVGFTIGADGTFTAIGPACDGIMDGSICFPPIVPPSFLPVG